MPSPPEASTYFSNAGDGRNWLSGTPSLSFAAYPSGYISFVEPLTAFQRSLLKTTVSTGSSCEAPMWCATAGLLKK